MAWIWAVMAVAAFLLHVLGRLNLKSKKIQPPPGPMGLPILGHLHLLAGLNPHHILRDLARKYGPIMGLRLGFIPTIIISSPAAAELVLKTHDVIFASRPPDEASKNMSYNQRNLINAPFGTYWRNMRKLCNLELLSTHRIAQFQHVRKAEVALLVNSFRKAAERGETVDLSAGAFLVSGDVTCLMIFGRKYSGQEFDMRGFKDALSEALRLSGKFNLADYFPYIGVLDLQGMNRKMKRLSQIFDVFMEKIVEDHVHNKHENKKTGQDLVDTMLSIMESGEAEFEFDRRHLKALLLDLLVAGSDTSTTVIDWTMSELMRHPTIMKKLQRELESAVGMKQMVEETHLNKLEYLDFVIKETLRLHPAGALLLPHESTEDCTLDGFHIPKKSRVFVNVWAIGRDPIVWPDPDSFIPERFVGSDIDVTGHNFELLPFGSGRRGCPGMQLGLTMVKLVVAQLVHCFDWELPNGVHPSDLDMTECFGMVTSRVHNLVALPINRLNV